MSDKLVKPGQGQSTGEHMEDMCFFTVIMFCVSLLVVFFSIWWSL
jgi:hypothetical protein